MERRVDLSGLDWAAIVDQFISRGWVRLNRAVVPEALEALEQAAPGPWSPLPETEGSAGVRQAGVACHSSVEDAAESVRSLAEEICAGINGALVPDVAPLPGFNHAQWCRADEGLKYITPHRDPETAGGIVVVLTIHGRAVFRIWDREGSLADAQEHRERATAWETDDGDLVLMRGGGWPLPTSRCPIHEAESPHDGDRITLTLRYNKHGYGSDYFGTR